MAPVAPTNTEIANAVNCLTDPSQSGNPDQIDPTYSFAPFQYLAGTGNPVPAAIGKDVMVSSSLVTVPVFDVGPPAALVPPPAPPGTVQIVGFVQLFLNADGNLTKNNGSGNGGNGHIKTKVINMAGCGTGWNGTFIMGNGSSPVTVRLVGN